MKKSVLLGLFLVFNLFTQLAALESVTYKFEFTNSSTTDLGVCFKFHVCADQCWFTLKKGRTWRYETLCLAESLEFTRLSGGDGIYFSSLGSWQTKGVKLNIEDKGPRGLKYSEK